MCCSWHVLCWLRVAILQLQITRPQQLGDKAASLPGLTRVSGQPLLPPMLGSAFKLACISDTHLNVAACNAINALRIVGWS